MFHVLPQPLPLPPHLIYLLYVIMSCHYVCVIMSYTFINTYTNLIRQPLDNIYVTNKQ